MAGDTLDTVDLTTAQRERGALEATQASGARPVAEGEAVGARIARYVVLSQLGAGAMGVVLAAYDPELDRKVALKLLKVCGGEGSRAQARLQREAQALAKLDHPNVVTVHDVGVHDGQLFVGMEFVAGQTLGVWMATRQPWQEVLGVFTAAGRGLAAAHEAGLVHRDFKPDNVMLGDDGRVRVMDFGLARGEGEAEALGSSTEQARAVTGKQLLASPLTQTGTMMGTPAYMSLEQFEGEVADARADQFGFCVALYEALYGERPFAGETISELMRAVEGERVRSAPRGTKVPPWLRKVVVRGLAKHPEDRWPSMRALLDALADDPVIRRRRWGLAAAVVALLGGGTWSLVAAVRADARTCEGFAAKLEGVWDDARRAQVEGALLATTLDYAPATWTRVEARLDDYTQRWVAARVEACRATHEGEQSGELLDLRMACLDERLQHVSATVELLAAADATVVKGAVDAVDALPRLQRCADLDALTAERPPPEDPEVAERVAELEARLIEAEGLRNVGKSVEALELGEAVIDEAATIGYEPLRVHAWLLVAELLDPEGGQAMLERAYTSAVGLKMTAEAAKASARLMYTVGFSRWLPLEGRQWARHAEALARAAGTDEVRAAYLNALGYLARAEGNIAEMRASHLEALALYEAMPDTAQRFVIGVLAGLAYVAIVEQDWQLARHYYERELDIAKRRLGPDHPGVATHTANLALVAKYEGNYDEAHELFEHALARLEATLGPDHVQIAPTYLNFAGVELALGKRARAIELNERARDIWEKAGPDHPPLAMVLDNLGEFAREDGDDEQARAHWERALAILDGRGMSKHRGVPGPLDGLADLDLERGDDEQARVRKQRVLEVREHLYGAEDARLVDTLIDLGEILLREARPSEALVPLERALTILESAAADRPAELARAHAALARALWDAPADAGHDRERARELAALARERYARGGEDATEALEQVDTWLAAHGH